MTKTIKVGKWYNKLTAEEKVFLCKNAASHGINEIRSFLSCARKSFSKYKFHKMGSILVDGSLYLWTYYSNKFYKSQYYKMEE